MPGFDERLEQVLALIDGCKQRGVVKFTGDVYGHVEFELAPHAPDPDDIFKALNDDTKRAIDKTKCTNCEVAPRERGSLCRNCYLGQAGVQT